MGESEEQPTKKSRRLCPYLGTINRHLLDFDFDKLCSISLARSNVYCCLVCGEYFQGKGQNTHAMNHALEENHYVFINLHDAKVYCLPDNYEVVDNTLSDIQDYLFPKYTNLSIQNIYSNKYQKSTEGREFIPGCIGLNNLGHTDFISTSILLLSRNKYLCKLLLLLDSDNGKTDPVVSTLSSLYRKIFSSINFKGLVSPHVFCQTVSLESKKLFSIGKRNDAAAFLSWLLRRLSIKLKVNGKSVVDHSMQGTMTVTTHNILDDEVEPKVEMTPFYFLTLELPENAVFKETNKESAMIGSIPIFSLLTKYDGETLHEITTKTDVVTEARTFSIAILPKYLLIQVKRFFKNDYSVEKNSSIVTFPLKGLDLAEYITPGFESENPCTKYDLLGNIIHCNEHNNGYYKIDLLQGNEWFSCNDLAVSSMLPQDVAQSECYIQLYVRQDVEDH